MREVKSCCTSALNFLMPNKNKTRPDAKINTSFMAGIFPYLGN
jgi:hypothetical protein